MKIDVMKLEYSPSYSMKVVNVQTIELRNSLLDSPDLLSAEMIELAGTENCELRFKPGWSRPTLVVSRRREEQRDVYHRCERTENC